MESKINPGKVFDLTLPLDRVAEGYQAMDELPRDQGILKAMNRMEPGWSSICGCYELRG